MLDVNTIAAPMSPSGSTRAVGEVVGLRERKKRALRVRILEASYAHFSHEGYAATTVDGICHELGISKATFFRYFPTKDAVLREVGDAPFSSYLDAGIDPAVPTDEHLRRLARNIASEMRSNPTLHRAMADAGAFDPSRPIESSPRTKVLDTIEAILAVGVQNGTVRRDVPTRTLALLLWSNAYAWFALWVRSDFQDLPFETNTLIDVFLSGARPRS